MTVRTVDLTPTWSELVPLLAAMIQTPETRVTALEEMRRMAEAADRWNEHAKGVKA